jgi:small subunit ribosomal protein S11
LGQRREGRLQGIQKVHTFAATVAAEQCGREAFALGVKRVNVRVQGPGSGRESAIQALAAAGIHIKSIQDVTPLPHNGCRPPKKRRV